METCLYLTPVAEGGYHRSDQKIFKGAVDKRLEINVPPAVAIPSGTKYFTQHGKTSHQVPLSPFKDGLNR